MLVCTGKSTCTIILVEIVANCKGLVMVEREWERKKGQESRQILAMVE